MAEDAELLRQYVNTGSEDAFTELVNRHLPLVYSVALRQVGGEEELAKDVAQAVSLTWRRKRDLLPGASCWLDGCIAAPGWLPARQFARTIADETGSKRF